MSMSNIFSHRHSAKFTVMLLILAVCMSFASTVRAEMITSILYTSDWLTPGDELILNDSAQGLQWLNLNVTKGLSYNDVQYALSHGGSITLSDGTEYDISGWTVASQSVADQLLLDAGITLASWSEARAPVEGLLSLWGTLSSSSTDWHSRALTATGYSEYLGYRNDGTGYAVWANVGHDFSSTDSGVALERTVPEPATLAVLVSALMGLGVIGLSRRAVQS
jgi:hypothetical protein